MHAPSHPEEPPPSDQTLLVLLAQTGDRAALEQLLRNSHAPLRRYITRLAGADLADDILQETSIQIFRKLRFLREPAVFHAWTLRIASRIAIAHLKRATVGNPSTTLHSEPSLPVSTLAGQPTPPSSLFSTTSLPPAELSSFSTTSTIFHSKKPQLFSTFL
jgi:RNA polymerase sigma-70 factor, ECF subfamily